MKYNIPVIVCLRGLAATAVCFYHFVYTTTGYVTEAHVRTVFEFASLGVQMFFVISGIVIPVSMIKARYSLTNWAPFMAKRVVRIEPPYLAAIAITLIYFQLRAFVPSSAPVDITPPLRDLILHVGYLVPFFDGAKWANGAFWTLSIEFQYYLVLSFTFPLVLRRKTLPRVSFYVLFLLMPFVISDARFLPHHSSLFLMGIAYGLWYCNIINRNECVAVLFAATVVGILTLPVAAVVTGIVTLAIVHFLTNYSSKFLVFLGTISYSLYLTHEATGSAIINFLSHRFRQGYQQPIVIGTGYVISVACAYVMYRLVEKPSHNMSKKIKFKKKIAVPVQLQW
jgi:peptidoglycan/LPS O-acetylase OafA/YrhL